MTRTAAFFRVEGTLSARPTLTATAWLAGNAQAMGERLFRLGNVALAAPFALRGEATTASRMAWMGLRGISEDRLVVLGAEYADRWLVPAARPAGVALVAQARALGRRIVLVSDNLDVVVGALAAHLDVPERDLLCNRMVIRDGKATGELAEPAIVGSGMTKLVRGFAEREGIDLSLSAAYGARGEDALLLGAIGSPCAVHPDRALRQAARELDWPVVES